MQRKKEGRLIEELQNAHKIAPAQNQSNEERAALRKPGAWAELPKPAADWDSTEINNEISQALLGDESSGLDFQAQL